MSSLGFSFTNAKEVSNLHPYKSTPLVPPFVMQSTKKKAITCLTVNSKMLPTSESVLTSEINNNK